MKVKSDLSLSFRSYLIFFLSSSVKCLWGKARSLPLSGALKMFLSGKVQPYPHTFDYARKACQGTKTLAYYEHS
jgi:hypothetical protein